MDQAAPPHVERGPRLERGPTQARQVTGVLEMHPKGYGFLRDHTRNYPREPTDPFVGAELISRYGLREGVMIQGTALVPPSGQGPRLSEIESVEGLKPDDYPRVKKFDDLTAVDPTERIHLEIGAEPLTMRILDLFTPIGKGQRGLIVAPPRTGKTILLQQLAASVTRNHPELYVIMLLIDERPEEVTEMRRCVHGEVVASSMDREVESHVRLASLLVERAKRLTELGKDVFVLLDSITRLARAHNKYVGGSGRTMSGGIDIRALEIPKKLFGTARCFEEQGSLTVMATALIETGSRMDEIIFQEFKGTGNMEVVLDRKLADRRIWPAMDLLQSGTRKEEKLLDAETLRRVTLVRRSLAGLRSVEAMESLVNVLGKHPSNAAFLERVSRFQS
jgi:transcription termination factor Rho